MERSKRDDDELRTALVELFKVYRAEAGSDLGNDALYGLLNGLRSPGKLAVIRKVSKWTLPEIERALTLLMIDEQIQTKEDRG